MLVRAAVVKEPGAFSLESLELDRPRPEELLVKIVATGMCHTDLAVRDQHLPLPLPMVLGHEGAGVVLEVGSDVKNVAAGDHVVLTFASCGECPNCKSGKPAYCVEFVRLNASARRPDGSCTHHQHGQPIGGSFFYQSSFATHAIAHHRNVVKVPADLPLDVLAPLGCGVQTGAGAVFNCLRAAPGSSIAVFGAGAVGMSAIMAAKVAGCRTIIAMDVNDERLAFAKELGATHAINSRVVDGVAAIHDIEPGGVNYTIVATGIPGVMTQAVEALSSMGTAVLLGVAPHGAKVTFDAASLLGGRTIRSTIEGDSVPAVFIPHLIDLYRKGEFPFDRLSKFYEFEQMNQAAKDSESGVTIKPVIRMPRE
jgi:aryl-alcohol dehydrogenase